MDPENLANRIESELASTEGREAPPPLLAPPRVPDHQLIRRIGGGSYGEVWLARSITGQWRAVKVVARARFASDRPYEREFRGVVQFEPISRAHSGLVQVLHVGRDEAAGAFFYVMELADDANDECRMTKGEGRGQPAAHSSFVIRNLELYAPHTLRSALKAPGRLPVAEAVALGVQLTGALGHI